MAASKVSMKLLIDNQNNKVLFAEAGKECVDFLFHILSLPIATVITLLKEQGMVGSLGNLYESIENLNDTYIQSNVTKNSLLKPAAQSVPLFLLGGGSQPTGKVIYKCGSSCLYYSDVQGSICGRCNNQMNSVMTYVAPPATAGKAYYAASGFVKGVVTYMVMDDLVVKPMSTISSLTLLNQFKVKDIGSLKEEVINIGMNEAVKLLKTSLHSKKVLTDVFLGMAKTK